MQCRDERSGPVGLKVLLYPDQANSKITVNEHLAFIETTNGRQLKEELTARGAMTIADRPSLRPLLRDPGVIGPMIHPGEMLREEFLRPLGLPALMGSTMAVFNDGTGCPTRYRDAGRGRSTASLPRSASVAMGTTVT